MVEGWGSAAAMGLGWAAAVGWGWAAAQDWGWAVAVGWGSVEMGWVGWEGAAALQAVQWPGKDLRGL